MAEPIESLHATTDVDLLAAVVRGESHALGQLARRYGPFIHAAALRQTGDPATADDVTQAVLIVLSKKASKIAARALPSWLHQTTRYAAANANRAARRRRLHERRAARMEGQMDPTSDEINPLLSLLDDAIAKLAEADRQAIVGRFLLGQDAATVASTLGVSTRAAQKRIERAVDRLRDQLAGFQTAARHQTLSTVPMKTLAITPAVVAAVLLAAAPSPASAAVVAVPTVAAASLAKQTAAWMTLAKIKAAVIVIAATTVVAGMAGTVAVVVIQARPAPPRPPSPPVTVAPAAPATPPPMVDANPKMSPITHAALDNGIWIDYLGVSDSTLRSPQWFDVNGQPISTPPMAPTNPAFAKLAGDRRVQRRFAFEIDPAKVYWGNDNAVPPLRLDWERSQSSSILSPNFSASPLGQGQLAVRSDRFGVDLLGGPNDTASVVFRIAAGPWVPRIVSRADADVTIVAQNDVRSTFLSQPFEDKNEATIWYRNADFYSRPDVRLVAFTTDGVLHYPQQQAIWYRSPQQRAEEPLLDKQLPKMQIKKATFGQVLKLLESQGVPIAVKWDELRALHNLTPETPVTSTIGPGPLSVAMSVLLGDVSNGGEPQFDVKDGVVTVRAFDPEDRRPWAFYVPRVPLAKLDHFEVQTRNFDQWIAFENLSAELGKPAKVTTRTSDDPAPQTASARPGVVIKVKGAIVTLANGRSVELIAIGDAKTGECWRPDGTPCPVPFEYRPQEDYPVGPGKRRVWAMTVTRDATGKPILARPSLLNGDGTDDADGGFSSTNRPTTDGTVYQARELVVDQKQTQVDWAVGVASQPARKVSIERGPDGWTPGTVGRLVLENGDPAYVWGPDEAATNGLKGVTGWQIWTPPSVARRAGIDMEYVGQSGDSPLGGMMTYPNAGGHRTAQCQRSSERLQRVTMSVTHYDLTAPFRGVALYPKK